MTDNLDSTLTHYRLHCVSGEGQIVSAHNIHAPDDNAALAFSKDYCKHYKIELWQGGRWVEAHHSMAITEQEISELKVRAKKIRKDIVDVTGWAGGAQ